MRILLFDEVRETADFFTDIWRAELEREGHTTFTIHMQHFEACKADLISFLNTRPDFALCYNNAAFSLEVIPGVKFWDTLGVPVINILFDHPEAYFDILSDAPHVCIPACCDRNHLLFIERFIPEMNKGIFLPHFGLELHEDIIPWTERKIPVLYVGSPSFPGGEPDEIAQQILKIIETQYDRTLESAIEEVINLYSTEQLRGVFSELYAVMCNLDGWSQLGEEDAEEFERYEYLVAALKKYHYLHAHNTSRHRRLLVKQLVEAGIDVYAYSNWSKEEDLLANPHFHYGGTITPMECVEKMRDSKIVLNSMPWFKDGNHDRICHGMLQKAVVISEESKYLRERFTDGVELKMFSLAQLENNEVVPIVADILSNPSEAVKIAENGYNAARESDTVSERLQRIYSYLNYSE